MAGEPGLAPTQVALAYALNQEFASLEVFWPADLDELEQCMAAADVALSPVQVKYLATGAPRPEQEPRFRETTNRSDRDYPWTGAMLKRLKRTGQSDR